MVLLLKPCSKMTDSIRGELQDNSFFYICYFPQELSKEKVLKLFKCTIFLKATMALLKTNVFNASKNKNYDLITGKEGEGYTLGRNSVQS